MTCDVCGLPDPHHGRGDGISSCDCPRCDCGTASGSVFCDCEPHDDYWDEDDDDPDWDDVPALPAVVTVELPGISR